MNIAVMPSGLGSSGKWEAALEKEERCTAGERERRAPGYGKEGSERAPLRLFLETPGQGEPQTA